MCTPVRRPWLAPAGGRRRGRAAGSRPMYGATHTAQAERAVSTSTKRNLPCASPTSLRASLWNAKTAVRSTRITSTPWRFCARASSNGNAKSKSPNKQSSASRWSQPVTVRPKSAPTTTRRGGSPITASNSHRTLTAIMGGDIEAVINALRLAEQAELLAAQT